MPLISGVTRTKVKEKMRKWTQKHK